MHAPLVAVLIVGVLAGPATGAPVSAAPVAIETPFARSLAFDAQDPAPGPLAMAGLPLDLGDQPMISRLTLATGSITATGGVARPRNQMSTSDSAWRSSELGRPRRSA